MTPWNIQSGCLNKRVNVIVYQQRPNGNTRRGPGTETDYWWGNEMKPEWQIVMGGLSQRVGKQTSPVGSFQPNPYGLYDTAGNVWEWVQDCWHENYEGAPTRGRRGRTMAIAAGACRGGSWSNTPGFALICPVQATPTRQRQRHWFSSRPGP